MKRQMRQVLILVGVVAITSLVSVSVFSETVKMDLKVLPYSEDAGNPEKDKEFIFRQVVSQNVFFGTQEKFLAVKEIPSFTSIVKGEPKYTSEKPYRAVISYGSEKLPFALDKDRPDSKGFQVLYFDSNRNGDLSDEKPVNEIGKTVTSIPQSAGDEVNSATAEVAPMEIQYSYFPAVVLSAGDGREEYRFLLGHIQYSWFPDGYVMFSAAAYREGKTKFDGKEHRIVLVDNNSNGCFNDRWTFGDPTGATQAVYVYPNYGDLIYVDPDMNDPRVGYGLSISRDDQFPLADLIVLDGKTYQVSTSATGETVSIEPCVVPTGIVKNKNKYYNALVFGDKGAMKISGSGKGSVLTEGTWALNSYSIAEDGKKTRSRTYASASTNSATYTFEIRKDRETEMPFGPPFKCIVKVASYTPGNSIARLSLAITDSVGMQCSDLMVKGKRPKEPSIAIASSTGKIIERGRFEYG